MSELFKLERFCILHAHHRPEFIVTALRFLVAGWLLCCLASAGMPAAASDAVNGQVRLAQAAQPQAEPAAPSASAEAQAPEEPIGNVATVVGNATVTRNDAATPLKVKDEIYLNDVLQTSAKSSLGITFNDATTFNLTANAKITIDNFVYEEGGKKNAALFEVAKGTVAFVAASVAKTGDMKISTPTATLGIRGTSGVVEVPEGASASSRNNVAIKLYPDADGKVGQIEVNDRAGLRLGFLSQGASGFTIRAGAGARFAAVPLTISPQQLLRDQGFVRQVTRRRISDAGWSTSSARSAAPIRGWSIRTGPTDRVSRAECDQTVRSGRTTCRTSPDNSSGPTGKACRSARLRRRRRA
jgi:hypothetical protein